MELWSNGTKTNVERRITEKGRIKVRVDTGFVKDVKGMKRSNA